MPYTQVVLSQDPTYLQGESYSAQRDRAPFQDLISAGVVASGDFAVTWTSALTLAIAAGKAWVRGQNIADQGMYRQYEPNAQAISVGAGHATLPRLDQIILRIMDQAHDSSGDYEARLEVVPGTPTSGATLDNRLGFTSLTSLDEGSKNVLLLADVLVPAAASSINATNVRDRRVRSTVGRGDSLSSGMPPGCYLWRAVENTPDHALRADGSLKSRQTYSELFDLVGTTFGAGDGSTTFGLPNVKGRALVDRDTAQAEFANPGQTGGAKTHTLTTAQLPSVGYRSVGSVNVDPGATHTVYTFSAVGGAANLVNSAGGDQPHNILQPYIVGVCYITY